MNIDSMKKLNIVFFTSFILLIIGWALIKEFDLVNDLFLPKPKELLFAFKIAFVEHSFARDILMSVSRVFIAFIFSLTLAVPTALLMCNYLRIEKLLSPYIDFIRYLPVPALIPLIILFLGIDEAAKIALLFIGTYFQLVLLIIESIKDIPKEHHDLTFSLKLNRVQQMYFTFRRILPSIYDNSRITIGWCWTYVIIAELIASENGIGHMIKEAQRFSNTPYIYVGILTMGIIGFLSDFSFKYFYSTFFPYKSKGKII